MFISPFFLHIAVSRNEKLPQNDSCSYHGYRLIVNRLTTVCSNVDSFPCPGQGAKFLVNK